MGRPKAPCGTESAYRRHLRNGEPIDAACRDAHAAGRRNARRSPAASAPPATPPKDDADDSGAEQDDMTLIVNTLRTAFTTIAEKDPTRLAPIAREFRSAVEATRGAADAPKELTLAEQLAEARAARAARAQSKGAAS
ncbi:hypothetical protein [Microbacterium sp.]|uniref:hypothetical protein n=1 Tax=Microbacterium sp. TaxID=51671 RepID=UPI003A92084A